jgi:hypothetical protein
MATSISFRSNGYIWGVRILQLIFAIALLGITVSDASTWHSLDCTTPSKLAYHIAMVSFQFYLQLPCSLDHADVFQAAITLFPLAYFLLCTGPVGLTKLWSPWVQIALDAIFIIFWIVAEALSTYDCNGICSSCSAGGALVDQGYGFYVYVGSLFCECVFDKRRRRRR